MKAIDWGAGDPLTAIDPALGVEVYPATEPIAKPYVPFGIAENVMAPVPDSVTPLRVTDQTVPDGRPISVNVTV